MQAFLPPIRSEVQRCALAVYSRGNRTQGLRFPAASSIAYDLVRPCQFLRSDPPRARGAKSSVRPPVTCVVTLIVTELSCCIAGDVLSHFSVDPAQGCIHKAEDVHGRERTRDKISFGYLTPNVTRTYSLPGRLIPQIVPDWRRTARHRAPINRTYRMGLTPCVL